MKHRPDEAKAIRVVLGDGAVHRVNTADAPWVEYRGEGQARSKHMDRSLHPRWRRPKTRGPRTGVGSGTGGTGGSGEPRNG